MLDYVIDGKYDEKFTEQVKPDFLTPDKKEELYLYWWQKYEYEVSGAIKICD